MNFLKNCNLPEFCLPAHQLVCLLYPFLVSFCLQIAHRKVGNLQIVLDKLVGKVMTNLIHHTKLATCKNYNIIMQFNIMINKMADCNLQSQDQLAASWSVGHYV